MESQMECIFVLISAWDEISTKLDSLKAVLPRGIHWTVKIWPLYTMSHEEIFQSCRSRTARATKWSLTTDSGVLVCQVFAW